MVRQAYRRNWRVAHWAPESGLVFRAIRRHRAAYPEAVAPRTDCSIGTRTVVHSGEEPMTLNNTYESDPAADVERPLNALEFRDLVFNAIAAEPSMGDQVDVTDMKMFGDGLDDPHG